MRKKKRSDGDHGTDGATAQQQLQGETTPRKELNAIGEAAADTPVAAKKLSLPASDSKCFSRRRRKVVAQEAPATCPAFSKSKRRRDSSSSEDDSRSRPTRKIAKIPKKFVQEQQKYFAEVDAFELQEEESGSSESESES